MVIMKSKRLGKHGGWWRFTSTRWFGSSNGDWCDQQTGSSANDYPVIRSQLNICPVSVMDSLHSPVDMPDFDRGKIRNIRQTSRQMDGICQREACAPTEPAGYLHLACGVNVRSARRFWNMAREWRKGRTVSLRCTTT